MAQSRDKLTLSNTKQALETYLMAMKTAKTYTSKVGKQPIDSLVERVASTRAALMLAISEVLKLDPSAELRLETDCPQMAAIWFLPEGKSDAFAESQLAAYPTQFQQAVLYWCVEEVDFVPKWVVRMAWRRARDGTTTDENIPFEDVHCTGRNDCKCVLTAANLILGELGKTQLTGLFEPASALDTAASGAPPAASGAAAAASAP